MEKMNLKNIFIGMVILIVSFSSLFCYVDIENYKAISLQRIEQLAFAATYAVNAEETKTINKKEDTGSDEYNKAIENLVELHRKLDEVEYLYTLKIDENNRLKYFLDTAYVLQNEREGMYLSYVMEEYEQDMILQEKIITAAKNGKIYFDKENQYSYMNQKYLAAFAPVYALDGSLDSILGIDVDVTEVKIKIIEKVVFYLFEILSLIVMLTIVFFRVKRARKIEESYVEVLEYNAKYDFMTGLLSRDYFLQRLKEAVENYENGEQEFGFLFMDIDAFKSVNDRFGHVKGDQVIKEVAAIIIGETNLSKMDAFAGRYGGDEFVAVAFGNKDEVSELKDKIIDEVDKKIEINGFNVEISAGVMQIDEYKSVAEVIHDADMMMYREKEKRKAEKKYRGYRLVEDIEPVI